MKQVSGTIKLDLAQFRELAAFAQFGSDLDEATRAKLERGKRIVEVFKQAQFQPVAVPVQVCILWAVQNGYFDDVKVDDLKNSQAAITTFLQDRKADSAEENHSGWPSERRGQGRPQGSPRRVQVGE